MYIELLPVVGKYRGVTRYFCLPERRSLVHYRSLEASYNKYLEWVANHDDEYNLNSAIMLLEFCKELNNLGCSYEVVGFSDLPKEFELNKGFLGFDVFGDLRSSALEEGNTIDKYFSDKLNSCGLFSNYVDATEFCNYWRGLIDSGKNPYETEENPRPFCVWRYLEDKKVP